MQTGTVPFLRNAEHISVCIRNPPISAMLPRHCCDTHECATGGEVVARTKAIFVHSELLTNCRVQFCNLHRCAIGETATINLSNSRRIEYYL
jgi:hypothetical protein